MQIKQLAVAFTEQNPILPWRWPSDFQSLKTFAEKWPEVPPVSAPRGRVGAATNGDT